MAIQYAGGTIVNATLTQSAGTRAELAQWIRDELVVAGWTSSGSATDYQLTSATTPQSLAGRVRVYDPGSGNCARLKWSNTAGTKVQAGDLFLLPAVSKTWRIVANKYQFFVFTAGASATREFACGGVPYLPSFLNGVVTECIWGHGNAISDTDSATGWETFRTGFSVYRSSSGSSNANYFGLVNGNVNESNAGSSLTTGVMQLQAMTSPLLTLGVSMRFFHDNSQVIGDPLIGWGLTSGTTEASIRGQLWDAVTLTDAWTADTILNPDPSNPTYDFWTITNNNTGSTTRANGTLCVRVV